LTSFLFFAGVYFKKGAPPDLKAPSISSKSYSNGITSSSSKMSPNVPVAKEA